MEHIYVHYGADKFSIDKFNQVKNEKRDNRFLNKPNYGFWGSPVDSEWGWKDWCESEEYRLDTFDKSFIFRLKDGSKILTVRRTADVAKYAVCDRNSIMRERHILFSKLMKDYDGLELIHGDNYMELHDGLFYNWDCDSIVIWNPGIIEAV